MGEGLTFVHHTVLLEETVSLLKPREGRLIVDATLGGGGHAEALLAGGARVLGLDRDPAALRASRERLARFGDRFQAREAQLKDLNDLGEAFADGLLLDLGVSSPQLDTPARGFSFQTDGPLDMRMGESGPTAAELIGRLEERELAELLLEFGEERFARAISRELKRRLPRTTSEAVAAVKAAVPRKAWHPEQHVATRTFQALRIAVNDELEQLQRALAAIPQLLRPAGVVAIISFHSLEDRRVKQAFRRLCGQGEAEVAPRSPARLLPPAEHSAAFRPLTKKPVLARPEELARNPRARSAKLRAIERLGVEVHR